MLSGRERFYSFRGIFCGSEFVRSSRFSCSEEISLMEEKRKKENYRMLGWFGDGVLELGAHMDKIKL